jgi:predicted metal-binding membrane protein
VSTAAPALRRLSRPAAALLVVAAAAWVVLVVIARDMGAMPGTMGLGLGAFAPLWALMMTAMMLPTVAPFAALYARTFTDHRAARTAGLAGGYLAVWTLAAVPVYLVAWLAQRLVTDRPDAATPLAVGILAVCSIYQLTPVKDRCLARCRSPLGFVLRYGSYRGRSRDVRVGVNHGGFCLACCWALMAVLLVAGLMNVVAMVVVVAVVVVEKTWRWGPTFGRVVGVVAFVLAVAVVFRPTLAAGLHQPTQMGAEMSTHGS